MSPEELEDYLYRQDKKRIQIREKYKKEMFEYDEDLEEGIYFPKIHIRNNQKMLRRGLSWLYNGFLIKTGDALVAVDPGIDFLYRLQESNINPSSITHLFVSHAHLDHYGSANVLLDWLIRAHKPVSIIAPKSVFQAKSISEYHSTGGYKPVEGYKSFEILDSFNKEKLTVNGIEITPVMLAHGESCFGFVLEQNDINIGYLSDTGYALEVETTEGVFDITQKQVPTGRLKQYLKKRDSFPEAFSGVDILIANVETFSHNKNSKTHFSALDLVDLVHSMKNNSRFTLKKIIIAHVNPVGELSYNDWSVKIAQYVQDKTGISTTINSKKGLFIPTGRQSS